MFVSGLFWGKQIHRITGWVMMCFISFIHIGQWFPYICILFRLELKHCVKSFCGFCFNIGDCKIKVNFVHIIWNVYLCTITMFFSKSAPKNNTLVDFWRMIWQEGVGTIVMLTNIIENGKVNRILYIFFKIRLTLVKLSDIGLIMFLLTTYI